VNYFYVIVMMNYFLSNILRVNSYILLFIHITKVSPHVTLYRLKGKKRGRDLDSP
jgi:hypothetical protein